MDANTKDPDELEMIEELARYGINAGDIRKAKEAGYHTAKSIVMIPKKALYSVKGLSEAKVDKMVDAASKIVKCGSCGVKISTERFFKQ